MKKYPTNSRFFKPEQNKSTEKQKCGKINLQLKKQESFFKTKQTAVVVQLVEHQIVVLAVAGSSPVDRPI